MKLSTGQKTMLARLAAGPVKFRECDGSQARSLTSLEKAGLAEERDVDFHGEPARAHTLTEAGRAALEASK